MKYAQYILKLTKAVRAVKLPQKYRVFISNNNFYHYYMMKYNESKESSIQK